MTKKTLVATIVIILLFFGSGIILGIKIKPKLTTAPDQINSSRFESNNIALKNIVETQVKILPGTVEKILGDTITLRSAQQTNPDLSERTAKVTPDTKIFQLIQKDCAQFQAETTAFQNKLQAAQKQDASTASQQKITPPQLQEKKEITLSDLKIGQLLIVSSDDDISGKQDFTAKEITVQEMPIALAK